MCKIILLIPLLFLELFLCACLPVTISSPLGTTVAQTPDPRLTGMWKGKLGSAKTAYIAFYPEHDGVRKIVVLAAPTVDDGWVAFDARGATLGGNTYLDARETAEDGKAPDRRLAHVPVLYKLSGDGSLMLYLIDEKAARIAVQKGAIAGNVEVGEFGDTTLTAAPALLDAFFASAAGRALFTEPLGILQRVK